MTDGNPPWQLGENREKFLNHKILHNLAMPDESAEYRVARNKFLAEEMALRRQIETVAALRRALPAGGTVAQEYMFDGEDGPLKLSDLSKLGIDTLAIYSFMYGPGVQCRAPVDPLSGWPPTHRRRCPHLNALPDERILNFMVKFQDVKLDLVFRALSHSARRGTLEALVDGERSVSDLAAPHGMSLVGFMKHLRVLEEASLIACGKEGRVVRCVLVPERIREAATWLARYERFWDARLDALGRHLYHQKEIDAWPKKMKPASPQRSDSTVTTTPLPKPSGARGPTRKR